MLDRLDIDSPVYRAERRIASAVITQALRDLLRVKPQEKAYVDAFLLTENPDLTFWCAMGGLNANAIIAHSRTMLEQRTKGKIRIPVRHTLDQRSV